MKKIQPLSGFRDLFGEQLRRRDLIIGVVKAVYESYGMEPLETPAIERLSTLTGKYGDEGEGLIYKLKDAGGRDLALRYDLTVPLARVMSQYQNEIALPYRRYQIGPVWRGESPQAGRYREFLQFDADILGEDGRLPELECLMMVAESFTKLGLKVRLRVNNRKLFTALGEFLGIGEKKMLAVISNIDKVDKIGVIKVESLNRKVLGPRKATQVSQFLKIKGSNLDKIKNMTALIGESEGLSELKELMGLASKLKMTDMITFDQSIARGLSYYTGFVFETNLISNLGIGSVCSGGRYDRLISTLGGPEVKALGFSIGVDRLLAGIDELKLPEVRKKKALIINFGSDYLSDYLKLAEAIRAAGQIAIIAPELKLGKQFKLAEQKNCDSVVIFGEEEKLSGVIKIKNLATRTERKYKTDKIKRIWARVI